MTTCMCCPAFRPRYKRLVDNIFPTTNEGGLVRSEMEKLVYYALSAPEKLDRIGQYLAHILTRSISRKRDDSVFVAMEALDQLLLACHAQQINSFVESFLRMVANLLESDNLHFQALGTNSFVKFSKIEEDTVSYHRRYDFFVSKFSSMCHSNLEDMSERRKIRGHGVKGIHGIIRKTVTDDLQVNIWQKQHMEKIVPSLLYVMMQEQTQDETPARRESAVYKDGNESLGISAEDCLRELLSRASYANVESALRPAMSHLDSHKQWKPVNTFAIKCFKVFMFAIQAQYTHVIVKMLLDHLDAQNLDEGTLKANILEVLCSVVVIPSMSPIGPAVVEVFNQLARHLTYSVDSKNHKEQEIFQRAFINTIGVLCDVLPDFQKLEAMVFFITKAKEHVTKSNLGEQEMSEKKSEKLLGLLLQSMYRIAENYRNKNLSGMSSSLLEPLIKVSNGATRKNRLIMQKVVIRLLDRERNFEALDVVNSISAVENMKLTVTEASTQDSDIIERKVPTLLQFIYESSCLPDNTSENYVALYKCASMLCISLSCPDIVTDLCRVMLSLQNRALGRYSHSPDDTELDGRNRTFLVNMMSSSLCVLAYSSKVSGLVKYVSSVMQSRAKHENARFLDPCFVLREDQSSVSSLPDRIDESLLFSGKNIQAALADSSSYKTEKISQPFIPNIPEVESVQMRKSYMDADSIKIEVAVPQEDHAVADKGLITPKMITYDYLKRRLTEPAPTPAEFKEMKLKAVEHIMNSTFEQLVAEVQSKTPSNTHLMELITKACNNDDDSNITMLPYALPEECQPGSNNIVFPAVCVL